MNNLIRALLCTVFLLPVSITATTYNSQSPANYVEMILSEDPYRKEQIECLAKNIYFEARGEPVVGQIAVAQVTMNRVRSEKFPNDVCSVIYQAYLNSNGVPKLNKCQFSWYCDGKPEVIDDDEAFRKIELLAENLYDNDFIDLTEGAEYYHTRKVNPAWSKKFYKTVAINDHIFYARR